MQILPTSAASAAAGNVSQATSRDRAPGGAAEAAHLTAALGVERVAQSQASDADRDAQGGGQGLDRRGQAERQAESAQAEPENGLSVRSPEPASQLDIFG